MSLRSDLTELSQVWRGAPWRIRLLLLVSGFLATSSVASLAEAVAKWKGFLLTGVLFYREYFRDPVAQFLQHWTGLLAAPAYVDVLTVCGLSAAAFVRGLLFDLKVDRSRPNRILTFVLVLIIAGSLAVGVFKAVTALPDARPSLLLPMLAYLVVLLIMQLPPRRAWSLLVTVYLVMPPLLVCLAAAVNLGLR